MIYHVPAKYHNVISYYIITLRWYELLTKNGNHNNYEIKHIPWLFEVVPSKTNELQQTFSSKYYDKCSVNIE